MRLRASFVVEDSVIIPLFTMITVTLILFCLGLHDMVISDCAVIQGQLKVEQELDHNKVEDISVVVTDVCSYINNKSIKTNIKEKDVMNMVQDSRIDSNYQPDFIRKVNAVQDLISGIASDD